MSLLPGIMCVFLACSTPQGVSASSTPASFRPDEAQYALRGNPNFSKDSLSPEQRKWYDRLWAAIDNPEQYPNATEMAKSGDLYKYRGDLQDYDNALLTAFRLTGDLRLLDEVSRISELMRKELKDAWHGTRDGGNGKTDGFSNWVDLYSPGKDIRGKDTNVAFDMKASAHVALFAWAFQNNRDLQSPAGYDYGTQADFWKDYLVNTFEKKWRKRNKVTTKFPFAERSGFHTYHSWMKWHYYMGRLTGDVTYAKEAERMARVIQKEFKEVSSEYGKALVWPRAVMALESGRDLYYLMPQAYARYVVEEAIDLHFENFSFYSDDEILEQMAHMTAAFVIDDNSFDSFARDIGGGQSKAGVPASNKAWEKMHAPRFAESSWSFLAAWDTNSEGRILKGSEHVFKVVEGETGAPTRIFIPVGMLLEQILGN